MRLRERSQESRGEFQGDTEVPVRAERWMRQCPTVFSSTITTTNRHDPKKMEDESLPQVPPPEQRHTLHFSWRVTGKRGGIAFWVQKLPTQNSIPGHFSPHSFT